ncbi:hypothetical protein BC832DRAFT_591817 [Gaertneriomyces semiglobifer]|nr:hypothetical protein BC832DRAFT_591817 [Gaertneriomyces semiglobifer]
MPAKSLDLQHTAARMLIRSTRRRANGRYKRKQGKAKVFGVLLTALVFMSLIGAGLSIFYFWQTEQTGSSLSAEQWSAITVLVPLLLVLVTVKLSLLVRWFFYWLALAVGVLLIINKGQLIPRGNSEDSNESPVSRIVKNRTAPTFIVITCMLAMQAFTLLATLFRRVLYPYAIARISSPTAVKWWRMRPISLQPGTFQYTLYDPWSFSFQNRTFSYTGSVNSAGVPHGYGMWCDDADTGEITVGFWKDGCLEPPFKAREFGSGDSFTAVKVAFATCSKLGTDEYRWMPKIDDNGIRYGMAGVECSVTGRFFAELPQVTFPSPTQYRKDMVADFATDAELGTLPQIRPLDLIIQELNDLNLASMTHWRSLATAGFSSNPTKPDSSPEVCNKSKDADEVPSGVRRRVLREVTVRAESVTGSLVVDGCHKMNAAQSPASLQTSSIIIRATAQPTGGLQLAVDGWEPDDRVHHDAATSNLLPCVDNRHPDEALIFIHGYNCSVTDAIKRLGQLLTLGAFPPWIKPFVFAWPSGKELTYFQAVKAGLDPAVRGAFVQLVDDLRCSGVSRIHLLSHSAGCKLAVSFAEVFEEIFQPLDEAGCGTNQGELDEEGRKRHGPLKSELCTFTLVNGDVGLPEFLESDFVKIRQYCQLITSYVDENDNALFWAEKLNRKSILGRRPGSIYTVWPTHGDGSPRESLSARSHTYSLNRTPQFLSRVHTDVFPDETAEDDSSTDVMAFNMSSSDELNVPSQGDEDCASDVQHPKLSWQSMRKAKGMKLRFMLLTRFDSYWPADRTSRDSAPAGERWERKHRKTQQQIRQEIQRLRLLMRGREKYSKEVAGRYLIYPDMDTIDTSLLDVNIHSMRHNYFNLNRIFVDDLLDIMVHRKRASERTTRLANAVQGGLVYQFLCAPSYVVNP